MNETCSMPEKRCLLERLSISLDAADEVSERLETVLRKLRGARNCQEPQRGGLASPAASGGALECLVERAECKADRLSSAVRDLEDLI